MTALAHLPGKIPRLESGAESLEGGKTELVHRMEITTTPPAQVHRRDVGAGDLSRCRCLVPGFGPASNPDPR